MSKIQMYFILIVFFVILVTESLNRDHGRVSAPAPLLTIGGTVLKESNDLDILGMTFNSKMTFEKHLRSVFRAAYQRVGILRKSWRVYHDKLLLGRWFRNFVLPVLEYFSAVWCSAADTHLQLLDHVVSGAPFLTGGVFECDIVHRRSVTVLCMLYKIRCNQMHPLCGALPGCAVYASEGYKRCYGRTSLFLFAYSAQNLAVQQDFYLPLCPFGMISLTLYSMVCDWRVSRAVQSTFTLVLSCSILFVSTVFPFSFFF